MALLMRRLFEDAQAKLRRMVEEHSANLSSRIDTDYQNTIPAPLPPINNEETKTDKSCENLFNNDNNKCDLKIGIIENARRSKSLSNTSSMDEEKIKDNNVKKTKSNPVKLSNEGPINIDNLLNNNNNKEMTTSATTTEDSSGKDNSSSSENQSLDQNDPQPGCSNQLDSSPNKNQEKSSIIATTSLIKRLHFENERLQAEITRLRRLVVSGATTVLAEKRTVMTENTNDSTNRVNLLEMELQLAKEALITLKSDRRRLKAEKFDLLGQMKQLYATLEDKEKEMRDFIRNYEQVRENETSLQQLTNEREERERERWSLLRHARDEAERSLSLAAQLNAKELQLQQTQEQLQEARRQLVSSGCLSDQESLISLPRHSINGGALTPGGFLPSGDRGSCSADSGVRLNSDRESGGATSVAGGNLSDSTTDGTPTIMVEGSNLDIMDNVSIVSSIPPPHMYQSISAKDCSPTLSPLNNFSRSIDTGILSRSVEQLSSPLDQEPSTTNLSRIRLKNYHRPSSTSRVGSGNSTWGSISRVFARSRHRNKTHSLQENCEQNYDSFSCNRSWSPLTEEGYAEKLRLLREASSIPMERWRAPTVLAWLEVALGMPQYGVRCAENIKSGKIGPLHGQVLLELSDLELECGLGITHPMHRKKLRLAIEEHRQPALVRYPFIAQLGHTWVSSEWLPDLGLAQYSENFTINMVDARMLEHLSKKELEKYLGVTRKFHQASIVHGIHLLRIMKYDRQALAVRRHQCENMDADPLVWTNQRFIRWARSIDLSEYADNLKDSGVHGGLVVLEPSFNGDTMATALGIPASKNIIRRHLTAELEAIILPARSTLEHYVRVRAKTRVVGGSLGRSFSRSCVGLVGSQQQINKDTILNPDARRASIRGSLSRALMGLTNNKTKDKQSPTSSSESSSVVSRLSPPLYIKSRSGGESPIYATPFHHHPSHNYNRRSDEYCVYLNRRSIDENDEMTTKSVQNIVTNSISIKKQQNAKVLASFIQGGSGGGGGSLQRNKKRHRRVRSIGDIDVIHIEPI